MGNVLHLTCLKVSFYINDEVKIQTSSYGFLCNNLSFYIFPVGVYGFHFFTIIHALSVVTALNFILSYS